VPDGGVPEGTSFLVGGGIGTQQTVTTSATAYAGATTLQVISFKAVASYPAATTTGVKSTSPDPLPDSRPGGGNIEPTLPQSHAHGDKVTQSIPSDSCRSDNCGDDKTLKITGISVTEVYDNLPFDLKISGRNIECRGDHKTRVSLGGVEIDPGDVSCDNAGDILHPNPPPTLKVHVHGLIDGIYDVALTNDTTGDTANSSSLPAPMQGLTIQDRVRVVAFSPSEVRTSAAFALTIAGSSFVPGAKVYLDNHELTGAAVQSDHSLKVNVPASWFASLPNSGNGEYTIVVKNPDGIKAFSDDTLLVHTGVDVLDFSPHAVYGQGDFTLTVAADGAV